jgi:hypothetical protein
MKRSKGRGPLFWIRELRRGVKVGVKGMGILFREGKRGEIDDPLRELKF